jgi:hypothetical protein
MSVVFHEFKNKTQRIKKLEKSVNEEIRELFPSVAVQLFEKVDGTIGAYVITSAKRGKKKIENEAFDFVFKYLAPYQGK